MMQNQPEDIVPSARNGQRVTWPGNKFQPSGWIVGETSDGAWFYVNAQAKNAPGYDWMVSRRAIREGLVEVEI